LFQKVWLGFALKTWRKHTPINNSKKKNIIRPLQITEKLNKFIFHEILSTLIETKEGATARRS